MIFLDFFSVLLLCSVVVHFVLITKSLYQYVVCYVKPLCIPFYPFCRMVVGTGCR